MTYEVTLDVESKYKDYLKNTWGLEHSHNSDFILSYNDKKLGLLYKNQPKMSAITVDFLQGKAAHRRQYGGGKNQTIAKAIGIKANHKPSVLDATAGLGQDAFIFASLGCQVTLLERHPVVAALLEDGLNRAYDDPDIGEWMRERMRLIPKTILKEVTTYVPDVDVVYLDPMYPHKEKSALVKKEMQVFQKMIGFDLDADELLEHAFQVATKRVVVKRPKYAEPLNKQQPSVTFDMKNNRFDVYIC